MASLVNIKVSIIGLSAAFSFFISALDNNFYREATIKRWDNVHQLSWDDFQGIPTPFTKFGAAISSRVYIEFDSATKKYHAYAGQNNMRSWVKFKSSNGLKHEQYHFNITELYARKLAKSLEEDEEIFPESVMQKLTKINQELSEFQDRYDDETDHCLLTMEQTLWEYKIDSMLQEYTASKGMITDPLTGLSARFPKPVVVSKGISEKGVPYRGFGNYCYGMAFSIHSLRNLDSKYEDLSVFSQQMLNSDSIILQQELYVRKEQLEYYEFNMINKGKTHEYWNRVYRHDNELFTVEVLAPYDSLNRSIEKIAYSFLSTVKFIDTKDYWINKWASEGSDKPLMISNILKSESEDITLSYCFGEDDNSIFFKPPFFDIDNNLYIAYDIINHPKESVLGNIIEVSQEKVFSFEADSTEQFMVIHHNLLPEESFDLKFGFLLKEDSSSSCYNYYKQSGRITRN